MPFFWQERLWRSTSSYWKKSFADWKKQNSGLRRANVLYASICGAPRVHDLSRWHSAFSRKGSCTGGCTQTPEHISAEVFLGLLNIYNRFFLPDSSVWLAPLHQLLKKNAKWSWERAQDLDFKKKKEALMSSHVLAHYDQDLPLILECDASHYRVGAVLSFEIEDGSTKPISFTGRSLTPTEKGTHTLTRRNWPSYLGLQVSSLPSWTKVQSQATTDLFAETKPVPAMALARVKRWVLNLSGYEYTIR